MRRLGTVASAVVTLVVLAGCTSSSADDDPAGSAPADAAGDQAVTAAPEAPRTLVADTDPVAAAVSASRALFAGSPVAVVAGRDDPSAQLLGAVSAVGLGVPLLLGADGSADALAPELDRLGVRTVLAVGDDAAAALPDGDGVEVVTVPAEADAVAEATGLDLDADQPVAEADRAAAVAALAPDALPALSAEGAAAPTGAAEPAGELPAVDRPEPLEDVVVLAGGGGDALAGIATARAAGASDAAESSARADPAREAEHHGSSVRRGAWVKVRSSPVRGGSLCRLFARGLTPRKRGHQRDKFIAGSIQSSSTTHTFVFTYHATRNTSPDFG